MSTSTTMNGVDFATTQDVQLTVLANLTTTLALKGVANATPVLYCGSPCAQLPVLIFSNIISLLSILANVALIAVIVLMPGLRRSGDGMLMADFCVSNILSALIVGGLSTCPAQTRMLYLLPACIMTGIAFNTTTTAAFVAVAAMAFDRYLAVAYHLRYASLATPVKYAIFIVTQWLVCIVANLLPLFHVTTQWCARRFGGCSYNRGGPGFYVTIGVIYLPSAIAIVFSYARIWAVIRKMPPAAGAAGSTERQQRVRGVRTTIIILSAYVITSLPRAIWATVTTTPLTLTENATMFGEDSTALFLNINALLSPVIYGLTNRTIKERLAELLKSLCGKNAKVVPIARPTVSTVGQ